MGHRASSQFYSSPLCQVSSVKDVKMVCLPPKCLPLPGPNQLSLIILFSLEDKYKLNWLNESGSLLFCLYYRSTMVSYILNAQCIRQQCAFTRAHSYPNLAHRCPIVLCYCLMLVGPWGYTDKKRTTF